MTYFGIDLQVLIQVIGYLGVTGIVFAESGLFIGFFLPGDSLLFTAGFLASQGFFNIHLFAVLCFAGAVLGDSVGYAFGRRVGPVLFAREDSLLFKREHLVRAAHFYETHGGKAIVLARFMPMIRTFAPIVAGMAHMRYRTFLTYNIVGGLLWATGLTYLGYFFGSVIPDPDRFLLPVVLTIIVVSMLPGLLHAYRAGLHRELYSYARTRLTSRRSSNGSIQ